MQGMWYLIEDFFEQSWIVKLFVAWGWLSMVIMFASIGSALLRAG
jgi:hypothetical protein